MRNEFDQTALVGSTEMRFTPVTHYMMMSCGHICTIIFGIGWLLAEFIPIPGPAVPAEELTQWLLDHKNGFLFGSLLMLVAAAFMGPWGAALSMYTRKTEGRLPVVYMAQVVSLSASVALFVAIEIFWIYAAYRAGEVSVEITQAMYDLGWFFFLLIGPVFYIWVATFAIGILMNPPQHQLFPRWIGYFCLASVLCWGMNLAMVFFREGPTAYQGMLPTWIPLVEFFIWMEVLTFYGWRAIRLQTEAFQRETEPGYGVYAPEMTDPVEDSAYEIAMREERSAGLQATSKGMA